MLLENIMEISKSHIIYQPSEVMKSGKKNLNPQDIPGLGKKY